MLQQSGACCPHDIYLRGLSPTETLPNIFMVPFYSLGTFSIYRFLEQLDRLVHTSYSYVARIPEKKNYVDFAHPCPACIYKIKIKNGCEIEVFVEAHLLQAVCGTSIAHTTDKFTLYGSLQRAWPSAAFLDIFSRQVSYALRAIVNIPATDVCLMTSALFLKRCCTAYSTSNANGGMLFWEHSSGKPKNALSVSRTCHFDYACTLAFE